MGFGTMTEAPRPLTREDLLDPGRRQHLLSRYPWLRMLSEAELQESLQSILDQHAPGEDVWIFAYGSLIWNPTFQFGERRVGTLRGYHRRFCLWAHIGRGSPERPGLFLGLERGGQCGGIVFRIPADIARAELELIWRREMLTGAYVPRWVRVDTPEGPVRAVALLINRRYGLYAGRLDEGTVVAALASAEGRLGRCSDYLFNTLAHLEAEGIRDRMLRRLARAVEAVAGQPELGCGGSPGQRAVPGAPSAMTGAAVTADAA